MDEASSGMDEYGFDIVSVTDDDGTEHTFEQLDRMELDDGRTYVALLPVFDDEEEILDGDGDAFVLKVIVEDGDEYLIEIEDQDEFNQITAMFEERLASLFEPEDDVNE